MEMILDEVVQTITGILDKGIRAVGFVSPSHVVPQVLSLISRLHEKGYHPTTVYNTNGYDNVETLRSLEGLIDVYLPDFKYIDPHIAENYSEVPNYPEVAKKSILEMYRQKGNTVICNDEGQAMTGLIIRHLVIPGNTSNSIRILEWIASELSTAVHISLMSQYNPTVHVSKHPYLGRRLTSMEYNKVVDAMMALGFYNGWLQDPESAYHYNPDFDGHHPFQDDPDEGTVIV
jgi:putative pyruvate formate lyase activating enzyme